MLQEEFTSCKDIIKAPMDEVAEAEVLEKKECLLDLYSDGFKIRKLL